MAKKLLIFFLLLTMITGLLYGCEGAVTDNTGNDTGNENEYGSIYEITEILDEKQFDEYTKDDGALFNRLIDFRRKLDNSSELDFYAFAGNFIEIISEEIPESCIVNHGTKFEADSRYEIDGESITAAEAIQVSENFFTLFPLKITDGRSFEASDFDCRNGEPVPVIMGKAYRDSFRLGDTFEAYYICEQRSFTVIGFTDAESDFYLSSASRMTSYENYIIMPFENVAEDSYSARAILLQQICGFIAPHGGRDSALQTIRECLTDAGLEAWSEAVIVNEKSLKDKMNGTEIRFCPVCFVKREP